MVNSTTSDFELFAVLRAGDPASRLDVSTTALADLLADATEDPPVRPVATAFASLGRFAVAVVPLAAAGALVLAISSTSPARTDAQPADVGPPSAASNPRVGHSAALSLRPEGASTASLSDIALADGRGPAGTGWATWDGANTNVSRWFRPVVDTTGASTSSVLPG